MPKIGKLFFLPRRLPIAHYVQITGPRRLWAEDLSWLLDRCDGILEGNVCVCVSIAQLDSLIADLEGRGHSYEILEEKPMTKPIGKYVTIILGALLRDQEVLWRGSRY